MSCQTGGRRLLSRAVGVVERPDPGAAARENPGRGRSGEPETGDDDSLALEAAGRLDVAAQWSDPCERNSA